MAGRNPKPLSLIKGHITNEQKEIREKGEKALTPTAKFVKWNKVKQNKVASKCFDKLKKAFIEIGLTDVLFEAVLNRYCLLISECDAAEGIKEKTINALNKLEEQKSEMDFQDYLTAVRDLDNMLVSQDKLLAKKRDQLLQIEKECLLTPQGKLRAVPKKPMEEKEDDPMSYLLKNGLKNV